MIFSTKKETKFDSVGGCVSTCFLHTEWYFWQGAEFSWFCTKKETKFDLVGVVSRPYFRSYVGRLSLAYVPECCYREKTLCSTWPVFVKV